MNILITGCAGFIGYHSVLKLINQGYNVIGLDNLSDYYDVKLKLDRLRFLGIECKSKTNLNHSNKSLKYDNFLFYLCDLKNDDFLEKIFLSHKFNIVLNLAAQPGVRYSLKNPKEYIDTNINGFFNLIEKSKNFDVKTFIYASSSSVYGQSKFDKFSEDDNVDRPVSFYAATKKTNELIAHAYSELYEMKTIGLRFFTVYGPFGRPDMAYFSFTKNIIENRPIKIFNNGNLSRDFTYIDDIVNGISLIVKNTKSLSTNYKVYNIGNGSPIKLLDFITYIEKNLGKNAIKEYVDMQLGDVYKTSSDINLINKDFGYASTTSIKVGVKKFINWYKKYYKIKI